jgi:hypothetical protein
MEIKIPRNARFLFLSTIDSYYRDNLIGPDGLVVTIEKDTDVDGIPDHWEINGMDFDKDGTIDLDLPAMGADWEHKDIFVEVDWGLFDGNTYPGKDCYDPVIESFVNAPVGNPDGVMGINLHVQLDEEAAHGSEYITWDDFYRVKDAKFGTRDERTKEATIEAKKQVFHYCLLANKQPGNYTGQGEMFGNAFLITLGERTSMDTQKNRCAAFMHELGHNLGLHHGGAEKTNYKPNYISVMNYLFLFDDYGTGRPLDYSRGQNSPLIESNLNENVGIGKAVKTAWRLPDGHAAISSGDIPIDWNNEGNITNNVQVNLNNFPDDVSASANEVLTDYDDWSNLFYRFRGTECFAFGVPADSHEELTIEEVLAMEEEEKNIVEVTVPESYVPSNEVVSFGLNEGDWFEYSVTWTGGEPEWYYAVSFKGEVLSVTDKIIEIQWESEDVSGRTGTHTEIYDVNLGGHTINIIPADLQIGATIFSEDHGVIDIDGEEDYDYAGYTRHVLWAVEDFGVVHWDEETGLLVQSDTEVGELHRKMLLEKTNAWENETAGLDLILVAAVGIIIVTIFLILLIIFRRKKKKEKSKWKPAL